ncbi:MAG: hypothetical protein HC825_06780 [Oscillatoriales cyanobacterium RM1_1_9]|nr:hypothetical protein [Oscillatoriales cyanobacterium RM1_1_9]
MSQPPSPKPQSPVTPSPQPQTSSWWLRFGLMVLATSGCVVTFALTLPAEPICGRSPEIPHLIPSPIPQRIISQLIQDSVQIGSQNLTKP